MGKIRQLTEDVVSRISAGEVIERPSFAVKELVENAIDAEAKNIEILIKDSGLTEITVTDDGEGMEKEDLLLSVLPHATSKIKTAQDLLTVHSLGFRGEGLSSLVAISTLHVASRYKGKQSGNFIEVNDSQILQTKEIGMPVGTRVTAMKLMESVPARKKFLKSEKTEFRHIVELVSSLALMYPKIRFKLSHNERNVLDFQGNLAERMQQIFGETVMERVMHMRQKNSLTTLELYLSHPQHALPSSTKLLHYVNGRHIQNNLITLAIKEAYGKLLDPYSFPIGIVSITMPHQFVDVNVHPTKKEVRFESPEIVFNEIKDTTQALLSKHNLTFGGGSDTSLTNREVAETLRHEVGELPVFHIRENIIPNDILIIDNTFLVAPHSEGLILFDQHAVHEALLFEAFVSAFKRHQAEVRTLSEPILMELTKNQELTLLEHEPVLSQMGFQIDVFGGNTIKVSAIPQLANEHDIPQHVKEILEYLESAKYPDIDHLNNKMLSFLACKSAIKAGDRLTKIEALKLISALNDQNSVYTCPHGRPVKHILTVYELKKMFKRV